MSPFLICKIAIVKSTTTRIEGGLNMPLWGMFDGNVSAKDTTLHKFLARDEGFHEDNKDSPEYI